MAAPWVAVRRMIEHFGNLRLRNGHGSGMIQLDCSDSGWPVVRSLNMTVDPVIGSISVSASALPALSCQV
jgi:hypothetical protein